jgi:uncharacterized protein (TIGR03067 family)
MKFLTLVLAVAVAQSVVAADADTEARKQLAGVWKGRVDQGATGHVLTFTTSSITGNRGENQDLGEGSFKLDLTKRPWKMDASQTKGPRRGKTYLGIYSLEGDTLKWCVSTPGNERPTEFATEGSNFLLLLKRQGN